MMEYLVTEIFSSETEAERRQNLACLLEAVCADAPA